MKLRISLILTIIISIGCISYAKDIIYSSKVIIDSASQLDEKEIQYQGEAIGDIMYRSNTDYGWVNVNDGDNAIGVWAKKQELQKISVLGEYEKKGDIILVTGKVNSACKEHGGDLDIHATGVEIIERGYEDKQLLNEDVYTIFRLLTIPTVLLLLIVFFIEKNKEKLEKDKTDQND